MEVRNRDEKTAMGMNLRSHSLDKLRQIITIDRTQSLDPGQAELALQGMFTL
jgi:hypothetical protein